MSSIGAANTVTDNPIQGGPRAADAGALRGHRPRQPADPRRRHRVRLLGRAARRDARRGRARRRHAEPRSRHALRRREAARDDCARPPARPPGPVARRADLGGRSAQRRAGGGRDLAPAPRAPPQHRRRHAFAGAGPSPRRRAALSGRGRVEAYERLDDSASRVADPRVHAFLAGDLRLSPSA